MTAHRLALSSVWCAITAGLASPALAQTAAPVEVEGPSLLTLLLHATLFGVLGLALLVAGYYVWDRITPFNLREELVDQHNPAVGLVTAGIIIGTAMVISAALLVVG